MELEDFVGDLVPLSFDQDISPVVLDMMRGMSYIAWFGFQASSAWL